MSCKANERHITFEEGCWTFHPNSVYHSVMLLYLQEEHVSCQCTLGSRLREETEKVNSLCECSEGSFLTPAKTSRWSKGPSWLANGTPSTRETKLAMTCLEAHELVTRQTGEIASRARSPAISRF